MIHSRSLWSGLVWSGLALICIAESPRSQSPGGVHPTVASPSFTPPAPGASYQHVLPGVTVDHPFRSPMMNFPDSVWNLGESPMQADAGGVLSPPVVGPMIPGTYFHPYLGSSYPNNGPTGGWNALVNVGATDAYRGIAPINVQHFVGYMRDGAIANPQDKVLDGGFEIFVSD